MTDLSRLKVLVSGAGPAGLTMAACLAARGCRPVLIERAPAARTTGYGIDVHENGWDVAARLGVLDAIRAAGMELGPLCYHDLDGRLIVRRDGALLERSARGKLVVLGRDRLVAILEEHLAAAHDLAPERGRSIAALDQDEKGVTTRFEDGQTGRWDLVIAADGIRSRTRDLAFGSKAVGAVLPLGYSVAAWHMPGLDIPGNGFAGFMGIGRQALFYATEAGRTAALFCWRTDDRPPRDPALLVPLLRHLFLENGPAAPLIRSALEGPVDWSRAHVDQVAQSVMPGWSAGRVVLLGDAAHCGSFLSGQGTSMAMAGAWILARELARLNAIHDATAAYEAQLRPVVDRLQRAARRVGPHYLPASRRALLLRRLLLPVLTSAPVFALESRGLMPRSLITDA
ncbi:FAD-dependent monooxygenase [Tistrella mobilis]|uniref:FAD-dependent monooxygenase n=1 Tax=Tistrella mobilis TaxID=171437 RepID=UPI0035571C66